MKESTIQSLRQGFRLQSKERTYEIVRVLGSGSFGITYLATAKVAIGNISTTVKFAIKEHFISASCYRGDDGATVLTVPTAKSEVSDSRADFIIEANRLQKLCLKSRNIVSVNETFEANGTAYYVMEFLDGGNPSSCSEEKVISIVMQVADALNEIHKERVLHLDLKPDNIVLKTNDKNETYPVLIDFGISKHFDSKGRPTSSLNAKGASSGFAPQEQYAGVSEFSPKYDIYALGAVLFFLCTGKNPPDAFKISPNQQELIKVLDGKVSPNIEKTILNAMKPAASERTPSIKQFCDDLMGIDFVPVLNISDSQINFKKNKGQKSILVDSNISWSVYSEEDWCSVKKTDNNVVVSITNNKETSGRACNIVVNGASHKISQVVHIKQEGIGTIVFPSGPTWWERNGRKVYQAGGVILIGCCLVGMFEILKPNPEKDSKRLTEAITSMDGDALEQVAKEESASNIPDDFVLMESGTYNYLWWNQKTQSEKNIMVKVDSFFISKYELTQGEYKRIMGALTKKNSAFITEESENAPLKQIEGDDIPVVASLKEIAEYCNKRSKKEGYRGFYSFKDSYVIIDKDGNGYRIPTEVEWLFAAHGGNLHETYKYSGGNKLTEVAWFGGNSNGHPHAVGQKKPNGKGLYDMSGNVEEYLWSSIFNEKWYPHPYMSYYMWVGTIDEIVGSQHNLGARIVLVQDSKSNNNLKIHIPSIPNRMKNI